MGWFSCFITRKKDFKIDDTDRAQSVSRSAVTLAGREKRVIVDSENDGGNVGSTTSNDGGNVGSTNSIAVHNNTPGKSPVKSFTYRELCIATGMFNAANKIGQGGFGMVYKGRLESGEIVAVKQLNPEGAQGVQEFITEVLLLSLVHHDNLVNLTGYCTDGDEKLLVYEYMPQGSVEDHLFNRGSGRSPLDWNTRIKIALDTAKGIEYLHCHSDPPVIFRDLKPANILLDNDFNAKLSDFGLAKLGPVGENTHVSTRVMGTYGYCAPEYAMSGKLTVKSDVFSFGVVLLELITGRKSIDTGRCRAERNLVNWSRAYFKDRRRYSQLADPALEGRFPVRSFNNAIAIAATCLQEQPGYRPHISDVVVALEYLSSQPYNPNVNRSPPEQSSSRRGRLIY